MRDVGVANCVRVSLPMAKASHHNKFSCTVSFGENNQKNIHSLPQRRPISIQERIPYASMPIVATTTTTTSTTAAPKLTKLAPEESTAMNNRLSRLTLPSNATSIRSDITDTFSCQGRPYGYYAGNLNCSNSFSSDIFWAILFINYLAFFQM